MPLTSPAYPPGPAPIRRGSGHARQKQGIFGALAQWGNRRMPTKLLIPWWAWEVCPGKAIPMAYIYKPPYLRVLNAKVFSERLQTASADNRLSRDCRHVRRASSAKSVHRLNLVIDHRGHIASPPIGHRSASHSQGLLRVTGSGPKGIGNASKAPLRLLRNGATTAPRRTRVNSTCTGPWLMDQLRCPRRQMKQRV
jgi:hypothetical protein